jgi:exopolysaccharide biosynthesis protein
VWLLACADGRGANGSPGLSFVEFARFFAERGAVSAMNLDGGGSSTVWTAEHGVVNAPADGANELDASPLRGEERDIADGILLLPR